MKKKEIKKIILLFLIWRLILFFIAWLSIFVLPYNPSFPRFELLPGFNFPKFVYSFANFDGVHYLTIAQNGYLGIGLIQAFFPVFPMFMFVLNLFINNLLLSGLLISNFCFLAFLLLLFFYSKMKFDKKIAFRMVILFLCFPASFFLGSIYNESFFLLLVILNLIFWEKKKLLGFIITGILLTATRVVGAFLPISLILVFIFSYWRKNKKLKLLQLIKQKEIYLISLCFLGIISYMVYLHFYFGDPLYFFSLQNQFGASRQTNLVLFPQVVWRYLKMFLTIPVNLKFYSIAQEFVLSIFFLILLIFGFKKEYKIPLVLNFFSIFSYFIPTLTGNFSSMPRYILVCFSGFLVMSQFKRKYFYFLLFTFTFFQIINIFLFTQGFWVS
jgi:Gpi18-like mannosyltransferase